MVSQSEKLPQPILVGIADKSPLMRAALKQLLTEDGRFQIVSTSESSEAFLQVAEDIAPKAVVQGRGLCRIGCF